MILPIFLAAGQVPGNITIITAKNIQFLLLIKIYTIQSKKSKILNEIIA